LRLCVFARNILVAGIRFRVTEVVRMLSIIEVQVRLKPHLHRIFDTTQRRFIRRNPPYRLNNYGDVAYSSRRPIAIRHGSLDTSGRRLPARNSSIFAPCSRHCSLICFCILSARSWSENRCLTVKSASQTISFTKSRLLNMRSSDCSLRPSLRMETTSDQPPMDRISPPPTSS
jgi:hypothetical protein